MAVPTPETQFTRDILGNYTCNTFAEAVGSRPFEVIIIGGGAFGLSLAQDLFFRTKRSGLGSDPQDTLRPSNYRILVLEGGPFALPSTARTCRISVCLPPARSHLHPAPCRPLARN